MYSLLITLTVILAIVLIIVVLLQSSKGGGLAGTFGGSNVGTMFGTRRTADFFSKVSWWLAGIILILAITYGFSLEFYQMYFVAGRSFDTWDGIADTIGAVSGLLFYNKIK